MLILDDDVENDETPVVNLTLICLNVAIAFIAFFNGSGGDATWALVPGRFLMEHDARQLATMFSSIFMHWGFLHLIGNMWVLYLFGDNVEDRLGHFTYLLFYLTCGFVAGVIHLLSDPGSMIPSAGGQRSHSRGYGGLHGVAP